MFYTSPIQYEEPVFRPPSEGKSILVQVTIGCSNNKCTYCNMYRSKTYRERSINEIIHDLETLTKHYTRLGHFPEKLFLCDGDALGASMPVLEATLTYIRDFMPFIKRVGVYATAENMLDKSSDDLKKLKSLGLDIAYLGLESGDDKVLHMIVKGNTASEMVDGSNRLIEAGIKLSVICMLGVGGRKYSEQHIENTAKVISDISPHYFSFLTTVAVEGTPYKRMVDRGSIEMLTVKELLFEMKEILKQSSFRRECLFRTNHVSNMYPIGGSLPQDKDAIVTTVESWYGQTKEGVYPPKPSHM